MSSLKGIGVAIVAIAGSHQEAASFPSDDLTGPIASVTGKAFSYPEAKEWLLEAGLGSSLKWANYIRPEVGVSDQEMGISIEQFRALEARIKTLVTPEELWRFLARIKEKKYNIKVSEEDIKDIPKGMSFAEWDDHPDSARAKAELANFKACPESINKDVADYVLGITDKVLSEAGITPNKILRAKAFAVGSYHFLNTVPGDNVSSSWGQGVDSYIDSSKGILALDRPRGVCTSQTVALILVIRAKSQELGISSDKLLVKHKSVEGGLPAAKRGSNHGCVIVSYAGISKVEAYDTAMSYKLDGRDPDAAASWVTGWSSWKTKGFRGVGGEVVSARDPISSLSRDEFDSIPKATFDSIRRAGQF